MKFSQKNLQHFADPVNFIKTISSVFTLGAGQLPDVNPASVRVAKKETIGMVFHQDNQGHYLPILPPGNPRMPRGKPEHSVMKMIEQAKEKT